MNDSAATRYSKSMALLARARGAIPSQTQTFSKGWTQYPLGASPVFATRANGGHVWDADGTEYIDWPMALGPLLLGHNHPAVTAALRKQLDNGIAFSLPTVGELELAERLIRWFPFAERVRFGKNGSDATAGAVRVARAFTRRDLVLCCGYHGWQDWFIGTTTRNAGVPVAVRELTKPFPYNDLPGLEALLAANRGKVAAIILEPMGLIEPAAGYLQAVRRLATEHGAILIFDECWTGFRIHPQGAFGKFGVAPDLGCFGKALGNGVPISAIVGRADVMDALDEVFFSFTFGGDMMGIAAAGGSPRRAGEGTRSGAHRSSRPLADGRHAGIDRARRPDEPRAPDRLSGTPLHQLQWRRRRGSPAQEPIPAGGIERRRVGRLVARAVLCPYRSGRNAHSRGL